MSRTNNYEIQAAQAKARFLTYDQEALIRKFPLEADGEFLYITLLHDRHRLCRATGNLQRLSGGAWVDANSFGEIMTLLDLICDSREDRHLSHRWKSLTDFGLMFHQNLLEISRDPWAEAFQAEPEAFRWACQALGGTPFPKGDVAYSLPFFDDLSIVMQLWFGDEEFPANLRMLWDENATMYLRYETMHFARGLILHRIREVMDLFPRI